MELAKKKGLRTGDVSTAEITDATPAGQVSHVLARGCQGPDYSAAACQDVAVTGTALPETDLRVTPVAEQIARNGTADVVLGGGLSRFEPDDAAALQAQGYTVLGSLGDAALPTQTAATQRVATRGDLLSVAPSTTKVFGLFNRGNLTVEKTKRENPSSAQAQEPTLAEMTAKSIQLLDDKPRKGKRPGFYLQVEGALIDKRSHANDAAQTLEEVKAFDEAVRVARDFAARDGHTLVIVTADHECAGFNIIEKGTYTNAEAVPRRATSTPATRPTTAPRPAQPPAPRTRCAPRARSTALPARPRATSPRRPSGPPTTRRAWPTARPRPASG